MSDLVSLLWLTQGRSPRLPSLRLRVLEIMPYLANRFEQTYCPAPTTLWRVWRLRRRLRTADVVVLQKELVSIPVMKLLRWFSRRLVYDFDDAVHVRLLAAGDCRPSRKRARRFGVICRAVDLVIAGNPILEDAARQHGARRTAVLPTAVALADEASVENGVLRPVRLGWIGTDVNLPYIEAMELVFLRLQEQGHAFVLLVMAARAPVFRRFTAVEFIPWTEDREAAFLAAIDIGLMPLADNEHTRGKCAYKALQYMSLGKPVVVSDVGVNAEWTAGAGYATTTFDETTEALHKLIAHPALRETLGAAGRARVLHDFSRTVVANHLNELLISLIENAE